MRAVLLKSFGGPEVLFVGDAEKPEAGEGELLIRVEASALNRADTLQRRGTYPPPPGASSILGLECAGRVEAVGPHCGNQFQVGDAVMGLLSGGGCGQYCTMPAPLAIRIPDSFSMLEAAAIPEVWMTAYQVLFLVAGIEETKPEFVLLHAGASGVGIAATQLAKQIGSKVIITCGSQVSGPLMGSLSLTSATPGEGRLLLERGWS